MFGVFPNDADWGDPESTPPAAPVDLASTTSANGPDCHTRVLGHQDSGANIITRCAGTKSHTYDESWHMIECHNFTI
jgi:hypothetical protein